MLLEPPGPIFEHSHLPNAVASKKEIGTEKIKISFFEKYTMPAFPPRLRQFIPAF
jgi:hypothetical protein